MPVKSRIRIHKTLSLNSLLMQSMSIQSQKMKNARLIMPIMINSIPKLSQNSLHGTSLPLTVQSADARLMEKSKRNKRLNDINHLFSCMIAPLSFL